MEYDFFELIILAMILGLIPAYIAKGKGYSFAKWWIFGTLLFIPALVRIIMFVKQRDVPASSSGQKKCPYCAEIVKKEAVICRFCQNKLAADTNLTGASSRHRYMSNGDWVCSQCDELNSSSMPECKKCGTTTQV
jgi:hypothetical protein